MLAHNHRADLPSQCLIRVAGAISHAGGSTVEVRPGSPAVPRMRIELDGLRGGTVGFDAAPDGSGEYIVLSASSPIDVTVLHPNTLHAYRKSLLEDGYLLIYAGSSVTVAHRVPLSGLQCDAAVREHLHTFMAVVAAAFECLLKARRGAIGPGVEAMREWTRAEIEFRDRSEHLVREDWHVFDSPQYPWLVSWQAEPAQGEEE